MMMTSARGTVRCPDTIEIESQNDPDDYEHEIPTFRNELTHSFDDSTSSIVSDSTEGSAIHFDSNNLQQQQDLSSNNISIKKSSDILIGSKTHFNGSVVIQNYIAGNESQNSLVSNPATLEETPSSDADWFCSLRTYIPCKSKWMLIILVLICVISALCCLAVAAYFLYLHFADYSVAGAIFVCKTNDSTVCYIGSSTKSCSNLRSADGRGFISGHTTSGKCKIYSKLSCDGHIQIIETDHVLFFFNAESARC